MSPNLYVSDETLKILQVAAESDAASRTWAELAEAAIEEAALNYRLANPEKFQMIVNIKKRAVPIYMCLICGTQVDNYGRCRKAGCAMEMRQMAPSIVDDKR